jgi:predicted phage replisome organizer
MSDVKWIKISTNVFDDEKIKLLETLPDADAIIIVWFKLLSMAGRCNDSGMIYLTRDVPYNEEMLSTIMRRPVNTVRLALNEFIKLNMIQIADNFISIVNWEKHQNVDGLDRIRENTRLRVQKHRENKRMLTSNVTVTLCNGAEKRRVEKSREDKKKRKPVPPVSIDDVLAHIDAKNLNVDGRAWYDYFEAGGWYDSKGNPVLSWKQKLQSYHRGGWMPRKKKEPVDLSVVK